MKTKLFVAPFLGDWGWQLMRYQAHIRHIAKQYFETIIECQTGHQYLYKDINNSVIKEIIVEGGNATEYKRNGDYCLVDSWTTVASLNINLISDYDIIKPCKEICKGKIQQDFIKYGNKSEDKKYDIVCHARNDRRKVIGDRNWSYNNWNNLISKLKNLKICFIGTNDAALAIEGYDDKRGIPLSELADILASSNLCIGPSSGPLHMSSLCNCRHFVWTDNRKWGVGDKICTNRERYGYVWNPLGTPAYVLDSEGWNPSVDLVYNKIMEIL